MTTEFRDYRFLGMTQSLCPETLKVIPAKIIARNDRVYFRKSCESGVREDFVCSDVNWFDANEYSLPGKVPHAFGVSPRLGCPYDCGLCEEHEQHTCIGLLEITSSCNLECPMCFASSGPAGEHLTFAECQAAIDRLVEVEGQPEILQLSGGEPTIHPEFDQILSYAVDQPIDIVMINTNGVRIARDDRFLDSLVRVRKRIEIYLQFDGLEDAGTTRLRGESLRDIRIRAIERLGESGIRTTLVCTAQPDVNEHEFGQIVDFAIPRRWITGVSFQPATYVGRHFLPADLERRITFPDVIKGVVEQSSAKWLTGDFSPLPCAHPNGHTLAYAYRESNDSGTKILPLARFVDLANHVDLLAGRITFNRERAKQLIEEYLSRQACGRGGCPPGLDQMHGRSPFDDGQSSWALTEDDQAMALRFLQRAREMQLDPEDVFRITTTSFMDVYNFDIRQLMKSCVHHILPSGHIIPFSAYNVFYRHGHIALPVLQNTQSIVPLG